MLSLEEAFICLSPARGQSEEEVESFMYNIAIGICKIKVLKVSIGSLWDLYCLLTRPGCFSYSFNDLKYLKIRGTELGEHLQGIICLLKISPNLENLFIDFEEVLESSDFGPLQDENITCLTYHLKVVQINYVDDIENHLELVRFLPQNAHVLEKMVVVWQKSIEEIREAMEELEWEGGELISCATYDITPGLGG
ncbi:FBD-associated F-box protein [Quillaja saponaria]|uniref:FBD-associated F-box protein n=1 Tax=Quillaja saponaria TaxID=32244 RepID=A0AAD7PPB1_QUISA|nr:FBD-associated F-box protein [Quillaja saponaria]